MEQTISITITQNEIYALKSIKGILDPKKFYEEGIRSQIDFAVKKVTEQNEDTFFISAYQNATSEDKQKIKDILNKIEPVVSAQLEDPIISP